MPAKKPQKSVAEAKKPKPPREPMSPEAKARLLRIAVGCFSATLLGTVCTLGFIAADRYVARIEKPEKPAQVQLAGGPPAWMNATIAEQILATARPANLTLPTDRKALADQAAALAKSPWVRQVKQLRRVYRDGPGDVIEIEAEFRTPMALVRWQDAYWYVDAEGVRLPERFNEQQIRQMAVAGGKPLFRVIEGAAHAPGEAGKPWQGKDIKAGLELVALLNDKAYADQVTRIDVGNFDGRVNANESQINLITRYDTQVRWGQAPSSRAFFVEQRVDKKLDAMQQACQQTGRVDMNLPWIDLRFDAATVPTARASMDIGR
ncbi:MAG: hypothetical protein QM754_09730 [Tepidisphaeraceae bacterium]